jgi:hypothetical protein
MFQHTTGLRKIYRSMPKVMLCGHEISLRRHEVSTPEDFLVAVGSNHGGLRVFYSALSVVGFPPIERYH